MTATDRTLWAPSHTSRVVDVEKLPLLLKKALPVLRKLRRRLKFNTLAVSGHSGIVLATLLAAKLKMPLLAVRKDGDNECADSCRVNGTRLKDCRYLIVDDLISSGRTVKRILFRIDEAAKKENEWRKKRAEAPYADPEEDLGQIPHPKCVGILLYDTSSYDPGREEKDFTHAGVPGIGMVTVYRLNSLTAGSGLL